jgi:hypothetical protein
MENIDWSLASTCVTGFTLWVFPVSSGDNKESIILSAYRELAVICRKLLDNARLNIRRATVFAFVRADFSMGSRIEKKLNDRLRNQNLDGTVYVEPVSNNRRLLTARYERQYMLWLLQMLSKDGGFFNANLELYDLSNKRKKSSFC